MPSNRALAIALLYWEMDRDPPLDVVAALMEAGFDVNELEQQNRY